MRRRAGSDRASVAARIATRAPACHAAIFPERIPGESDVRRPRVKVCCIADVAEARLAVRAGADALGLVSAMPSGPGVIGEETIAEVAATVPPPIATFLLTSRQDVAGIVEQQRRCGTNTIQLCDR